MTLEEVLKIPKDSVLVAYGSESVGEEGEIKTRTTKEVGGRTES